jgi:hypothetical protein
LIRYIRNGEATVGVCRLPLVDNIHAAIEWCFFAHRPVVRQQTPDLKVNSPRPDGKLEGFGRAALRKLQENAAKNTEQLGQQGLRFVRRGVCCCSAVTRGSLALPSPSLGVSSLDLGRSVI